MKPARILTINGGSSSIKFALFEVTTSLQQIRTGAIERIGLPDATLHSKGPHPSDCFSRQVPALDYTKAADVLIDWIENHGGDALSAVGHRMVHGGPTHSEPELITPAAIDDLRRFSSFDPEHLPGELLLAELLHIRFPDVPQVACFDTAFFSNLPRVAQLLPVPRRYEAQGVRRYGFHGLSYTYLMGELRRIAGDEAARGRIIIAHLGSGASLAAVKDNIPVDTSMGFTPTSGLPMSTRSGDLDPGVLLFMARGEHLEVKQLSDIVTGQSGMLGISQTSSDMRDLLALEADDVRAAEAIALFCYQAKKWIGAFAATLGGLDTLVFSGGIGEHAPAIRARICDGLEFLGIDLDDSKNAANDGEISPSGTPAAENRFPAGRVVVRVIPTDEELLIAKQVSLILDLGEKSKGINRGY